MPLEDITVEVTPEQAGRLDQIIREATGRSRSEIRGLLHHDCVQVNGRLCKKAGQMIVAGDIVHVRHDPHTRYKEPKREPVPTSFQVIYEDDSIIVVDKAAGILTVQTDYGGKKTLVDELTQWLKRRHRHARAWPVHRLDRDTSGLLVFGKTKDLAQQLMDQFRVRKAQREYAVIVAGNIGQSAGTFRSHMTTNKRLQRYSVKPGESGELAITHFEVAQQLNHATYLKAILETGRRNQIRVHFSEAGHPVLGDRRYRPQQAGHPAWKDKRLALHAATLGFNHPVTKESLSLEAPLPREFEKFLREQSRR